MSVQLIVRSVADGRILHLFEVTSLERTHVDKQIERLRDRFGPASAVDTSQVDSAREYERRMGVRDLAPAFPVRRWA